MPVWLCTAGGAARLGPRAQRQQRRVLGHRAWWPPCVNKMSIVTTRLAGSLLGGGSAVRKARCQARCQKTKQNHCIDFWSTRVRVPWYHGTIHSTAGIEQKTWVSRLGSSEFLGRLVTVPLLGVLLLPSFLYKQLLPCEKVIRLMQCRIIIKIDIDICYYRYRIAILAIILSNWYSNRAIHAIDSTVIRDHIHYQRYRISISR